MSDSLLLDKNLSIFFKDRYYERFVDFATIPFIFFDDQLLKFDAQICSIYFDFSASTHFFVLDVGLKARIKRSFTFLRTKPPRKLRDSYLYFWRDMKFLVFNSFNISSLSLLYSEQLNYKGYFPLSFYNSVFDTSFGILEKFSKTFFNIWNTRHFFFKYYDLPITELDFHISSFFGRGVAIPTYFGFVSFFRYFANELYLIHGENDTFMSLLLTGFDFAKSKVKTLYFFFKQQFFSKYFNSFKKYLFFSLFTGFNFSFNFFSNYILFIFNIFNIFILNSLKYFIFIKLFSIFYKVYLFFNFFSFNFDKFFLLNFFIFEFFYFFFKFFYKNSFYFFFKKFFKKFFFNFILFIYFFFRFFFSYSSLNIFGKASLLSNVRFFRILSTKTFYTKSIFRFFYRFYFPFSNRNYKNNFKDLSLVNQSKIIYSSLKYNLKIFFKYFFFLFLFLYKQFFLEFKEIHSYLFFRIRIFKILSRYISLNSKNSLCFL